MGNQAEQTKASKELGLRIKKIRLKSKIKAAEFANLMGVNPATVSNWEAGRAAFPADLIYRIAKKLEVSPAELIIDKKTPPILLSIQKPRPAVLSL